MKPTVRIIPLLACLLLGVPAIAHAQMFEPLRFTAPFAFEAGNRMLPAGTYVLTPLTTNSGGHLYTLSNTRVALAFLNGDGLSANPAPKGNSDEVVFEFDHATGHYVMCQVWEASESSGIQLTGTYHLTQDAKQLERISVPSDGAK